MIWVSEPYQTANVHFDFLANQVGNFVLQIEVEDLNSGEKDFYEMPFHVFDPHVLFNGKETREAI